MIKGMTGFGTAPWSMGKARGVVEVKSLNHRYLDIAFYFPAGCSSFEDKARQIIHKFLERGRLTVSLKIADRSGPVPNLNKEAVKIYLKYAQALKKEFGLDNNLTLADLIKFPGVVEIKETASDNEALWPAVGKGFELALKSLVNMRKREGRSLAAEINRLLKLMGQQIRLIQSRSRAILQEQKKILSGEEFSSFQKSNDVNEELARLAHYIAEFRGLLKTDRAVGKKLDFVAQEMQRETNTVGSKLQDKIVSNAVIALKSKIEKIRELSQNIE